jgi:hypothetical protein
MAQQSQRAKKSGIVPSNVPQQKQQQFADAAVTPLMEMFYLVDGGA